MDSRLCISVTAAIAWSVCGPPLGAQSRVGLFDSRDVLHLRIAGDLGALMKERDSLKLKTHPATLSYATPEGVTVTKPALLKLRGHWRRQRRNCDFAPIELDFPKGARTGTIFEDQGDLKLVTHCRSNRDEYEQYVLREYAVYQLANLLTPINLRARLLRVMYVDTVRRDSLTRNAFLIENEKRAAERVSAEVFEATGGVWSDVDPQLGALVSLFEYMIGGSDWSLSALHNIVLFFHRDRAIVWPMAYDFDWTGIVSTRYSFPDPRLRIRSVRQRLYRGICLTPEEWAPTIAKFNARRAELYAVYDSVPQLDAKYVQETREYLDQFFKIINDPKRIKAELIASCSRDR